jgi:hypothetical protein
MLPHFLNILMAMATAGLKGKSSIYPRSTLSWLSSQSLCQGRKIFKKYWNKDVQR